MIKHIAFIGVGNMGNPMAQQLVNAGKQVKVFDVSEQAVKTAKETGLNVVNSLDELLSNSSIIFHQILYKSPQNTKCCVPFIFL